MPETEVTTPATAVTDPNAASAAAVADPARTAIIDKYNQTYFGATEQATPDPITIADPVVTETATAVAPSPTDIALQALLAKVTSLETQLQPKPQVEPVVEEQDWLKLLSEGKKSDGEKALAKAIGSGIQQQAVQQALAIMQAERAVNDFVAGIRTANPDLTAMEPYIALAADARIKAAQAAGKVNSPADYVTIYKEAVTAEIETARNLTRTFQGIGATAATTRVAAVASTPTIKPNAVNVAREPVTAAEPEKAETASEYLAKRNARSAQLAGMATSQAKGLRKRSTRLGRR